MFGIKLPGIGDIAEKVCDSILPKELKIVGDLVGGYINFQTGNYAGVARQGMELFSDLNDLQQYLGKPQHDDAAGASSWSYEPPPPVSRGPFTEGLKTVAAEAQKTLASWLGATNEPATVTGTVPTSGWRPTGETGPGMRGKPPATEASKPAKPAATKAPKETKETKDAKTTKETKETKDTKATKETKETKDTKATTETKPKTSGSKVVEDFFKKSPDDFMKAVRDGNIPDEVMDNPTQMRRLQAKTDHISQMNQLMTSMLAAVHQMRMAIIHNVRV